MTSFVGNVVNSGRIAAATGIAVNGSTISGSIIDSGTIVATSHGIAVDSASEIVAATGVAAIDITGKTFTGGIVNSGAISGAIGIDITSVQGVSIFDGGTIIGSGGTAIEFHGSGNTLTLGSGYDIGGHVDALGSNTLALGGSGAASFDLSGVGSGQQYSGFTVLEVTGGDWTLSGSGGGWTIESGATAELARGALLSTGTVLTGGTLIVESGGTVGGIELSGNGIVEVQSGGTANVTFSAGGSGGLEIDGSGSSAVVVSGFGVSGGSAHKDHAEYIDFTGFGSGASFTYTSGNTSNTSGTLTVSSGGVSGSVTLIGTYTQANFSSTTIDGTIAITDPSTAVNGGEVHSANIGLFGNYIAGFVTAAGHGATAITELPQTAETILVHPRA